MVTDSPIVIEVWRAAVPLVEREARYRALAVADEPPVVRRSPEHAVRTFPDGSVRVGAHRNCDVVIHDTHLSRTALLVEHRDGTHLAYLRNRNGVEHRRWGQTPQPITVHSDDAPSAPVVLDRGNHAFIMFGGAEREVAYFVLVQVGPSPGRRGAQRTGNDTPTPEYWPAELPQPNERTVQRFREIYWQYLVWPPMLYPEPEPDAEFLISPAHAHSGMIRIATDLGYVPPDKATARQPLLPEWLIRRGLLAFGRHAQWRGPNGELEPYLAPDERNNRFGDQDHRPSPP